MRIQIAQIAASMLLRRRDALVLDASLPASVRGMINVHLEKPWIANFWTVAIRARKPGGGGYLDFPIGYAEDGTSWFFPSRQWWIAHAHASHPPDGTGCDADAHAKFLSDGGPEHEFDYGAILRDGTIRILGRVDFVEECSWWRRAFAVAAQE